MEEKNTGSTAIPTQRREIRIRFLVCLCWTFFTFGGYGSVVYLQTSINIEAAIGAISLTSCYVSAAIFGVVFTPVLIRVCGAKITAFVSQISFLLFVVANFYPVAYVLIPGGIIAGLGEAAIVPAIMVLAVHYAKCYSRHSTKGFHFYVTEFIGYIFGILQISLMCGSLLCYAILTVGKSANEDESETDNRGNTTRDLTVCGANDCQHPNVTEANLGQYVPATQAVLFTALGTLGAMSLAAALINIIFTPKIDKTIEVGDEVKEEDAIKEEDVVNQTLSERIKAIAAISLQTTKATLLHMITPKQLLITPFALYGGLLMSFAFGEMTRAFGSCLLGVDKVGICTAIFSCSDAVASSITSKLSSRFGRKVPVLLGLIFDIGNYMICLFWIPTSNTLWVVFIMFMFIGFVDGTWQPLINDIHATYFPNNQETAFTVANLWTLVGIAIQYGWSTSVCVRDKIYVHLGLLAFSIFAYLFGEYYYHRNKEMVQSEEEDIVIRNVTAL